MGSCKKTVYTGLDVCKLIAAILVVLLHTIETTDFFACGVKFVATRFAVPFFFITSGYFFSKGLDNAEDKRDYFLKYEKNLIFAYVIWAIVIYSPVTITTYFKKYPDASTLEIILLLIRRIFIIGPGPYWYMMALMCSIVFLYFCYIKGWDKLLVAAMVVGSALEITYACFRGVLSGIAVFRGIHQLIYTVYSWEFNFFMFGIPFTGIGYFIRKRQYQMDGRRAICIFGIATVFRVIEYNFPLLIPNASFWENNETSFAFAVQAVAFFLFAKEWKPTIAEERSLAIRQLSSFIYFAHAILLYDIFDQGIGQWMGLAVSSPAYIFPKWVINVLICTALFALIKKANNKYLNVLIRA